MTKTPSNPWTLEEPQATSWTLIRVGGFLGGLPPREFY